MGGLAVLAKEAGHKVTGCDANVYPPMSTQLRAQGIELIEGFGPHQLSLQPGSALGSGIVIALHAMLPGSGLDVRGLIEGETSPQAAGGVPVEGASSDPSGAAGTSGAAPRKPVSLPKVPPGSNTAAAIVLLSDGQSNV
eukprot:gene58505-78045_t